MTTQSLRLSTTNYVWPRWPFLTALVILFLGPIISPLFRATGLPFVSDAGVLARDLLSTYICPTPQYSYWLLDYPMAVCARCWGATIGLWGAYLLTVRNDQPLPPIAHTLMALPWWGRFFACLLPFLIWPLEIVGTAQGWWSLPLWVLLINGAQAGFAAGLFFCSIWPGMWRVGTAASNT